MSDAWDVFVLSLDPITLELERYGPAPVTEAFTGHRHQFLLVEHERRRVLFRGKQSFMNQARRLELLREVHAPAPERYVVARVGQSLVRKPKLSKPVVVPRPKYTPQEIFTTRQYEIALAALDAPKLKPTRYAA